MVHSLSVQRISRVVLYGYLGNIEDFNGLDVAVQCYLFNSMVVPILEYGADLCSGEVSYEVLENGLWPSTKCSNNGALGELGKFTPLQGIIQEGEVLAHGGHRGPSGPAMPTRRP